MRDRGQLSSGLKQEFIQQLLAQESCLCGQTLIPETEAYNNVKAWLKKVEIKNIEESAIRLETQITQIETKSNSFQPSIFSGKTNPDLISGFDYIHDNLNTKTIIDSRSEGE